MACFERVLGKVRDELVLHRGHGRRRSDVVRGPDVEVGNVDCGLLDIPLIEEIFVPAFVPIDFSS